MATLPPATAPPAGEAAVVVVVTVVVCPWAFDLPHPSRPAAAHRRTRLNAAGEKRRIGMAAFLAWDRMMGCNGGGGKAVRAK